MEPRNVRLARRLTMTMFGALTLLMIPYAIMAAARRLPWDFAIATLGLIAFGLVWELYFATRAGRPSVVERWTNRGGRLPSRRFLSIGEMQAEYAQSILDDTATDAALSIVLDDIARGLTLVGERSSGRKPHDLASLTMYVNAHVNSLSDPDHRPLQRIYRGYSTDLLVVAAACRVADRLQRG